MKKRVINAVLWQGVLLASGHLMLMILFFTGKSDPNIDYLAILNRPVLEATEEDKGWTIYRDLWIKHRFCEGGFDNQVFFRPDQYGNPTNQVVSPSDGEAWQVAIQRLDEIEDLLEGFRVGGIRPSFGLPLVTHQSEYAPADFRAIYPTLDYQKCLSEYNENYPGDWILWPRNDVREK